ncbi:MAG: hypothetical protein IPK80_03230 [Nannocystis sp.]|nr:hypothetical protein [Nannocystis sp.]
MIPWLRAVALCTLTASCAAVVKTMPTPDPAAGLDPHWHRGVFIEIFVRAWKDSDGDGTGDLKGLTDTLDYLQTLGVRGIWLMPITANSDGDHGYSTTDYRAIDPAYGTFADFDRLISEAAARGIGVIMDYVANHASAEHPYFVEARAGTANRYRDWFVWAEALKRFKPRIWSGGRVRGSRGALKRFKPRIWSGGRVRGSRGIRAEWGREADFVAVRAVRRLPHRSFV